ncbi:MAG: hypothetical protein QXU32_06745 [Nitrososphaerales archaeon]
MTAASETVESEVHVGYKIKKKNITLELKEYINDKAWCRCSACGDVVPALENYTKEELENWLDNHIALFPREHAKSKNTD